MLKFTAGRFFLPAFFNKEWIIDMDLKALEKFYTPTDLVQKLVDTLPLGVSSVIEPSAGNGAWLAPLVCKYGLFNVIGLDLEPEDESILRMNWFDTSRDTVAINFGVAGNPPFSLALKFINHAADLEADWIAFILPPSFKKASVQNKINRYYHLITELDIGEVDFTLGQESVSVPVVWQIWELRENMRPKIPVKTKSNHFKWLKTFEGADLAVRRVGAHAGKIMKPNKLLSPESHLFLKFTEIFTDEYIQGKIGCRIPVTDFSKIKSLTKEEVIDYVEECLHSQPNS